MALAELKQEAIDLCRDLLCCKAKVLAVAPGRVEVLGNHTDYNEGLILSAAIDRHVVIAGRATGGKIASLYANAYERLHQFDTRTLTRDGTTPWCDYVMGVVDELQKAGHEVGGFEMAIVSDVPLGAGLSSSAALEVAVAKFLAAIFDLKLNDRELALLCQRAENNFVGMNCGILDQWSSTHGKADQLIYLDCRNLSGENVPLGEDVELVLANTNAPHQLVDGAYNRLREGCFDAAKRLAKHKPEATHLRDFSQEEFDQWADELPDESRRRASHIVGENTRVTCGIAALKDGDLVTMGKLMTESHASSRDSFGNSCAELDTMVDLAIKLDGCYGARLSGGGFGGCTVNLVAASKAPAFAEELAAQYEATTGIAAEMHLCRAVEGAYAEEV